MLECNSRRAWQLFPHKSNPHIHQKDWKNKLILFNYILKCVTLKLISFDYILKYEWYYSIKCCILIKYCLFGEWCVFEEGIHQPPVSGKLLLFKPAPNSVPTIFRLFIDIPVNWCLSRCFLTKIVSYLFRNSFGKVSIYWDIDDYFQQVVFNTKFYSVFI